MATEAQVDELERKLETDAGFRQRYETNPLDALARGGLPDLALELEQETVKVRQVVERLETDHAFRAQVGSDPRATLQGAGLDEQEVEPFLHALDAPPDVLAKVSSDVDGFVYRPPIRPRPWLWDFPQRKRPPWFPPPRRNVFET